MKRTATRFKEHVKSPVTIRSVLLFFAIVFVVYIVWRDIADHRAQTIRYQRIDEQIARWQAVQDDTNRHSAVATQTAEATNEQMRVLQDMNSNFAQMTRALQQAELDRQSEHKEIARQLALSARIIDQANRARSPAVARSRTRRSGNTCWATITTTEKHGAADVIKRELKRVPCPK